MVEWHLYQLRESLGGGRPPVARKQLWAMWAATPWGGFKQSGWGRELGSHALDLYTEIKNVIVDIA